MADEEDDSLGWDHENPAVLGSTVLIGITYMTADGTERDRMQWCGRVLAFNMKEGLKVELSRGGGVHAFPPFRDALRPAAPGMYHLRRTGEVVENPDCLYTIASFDPDNSKKGQPVGDDEE